MGKSKNSGPKSLSTRPTLAQEEMVQDIITAAQEAGLDVSRGNMVKLFLRYLEEDYSGFIDWMLDNPPNSHQMAAMTHKRRKRTTTSVQEAVTHKIKLCL